MSAKYRDRSTKELAMMAAEIQCEIASRRVRIPTDVLPFIEKYRAEEKEHFFVVTLDGAHQVIDVHTVSVGIANRTIVHPREVFRPAIIDSAVSIIIGHNHPSGALELSEDDKQVIARLNDAAKILGILLLDHILIGPCGISSAVETGDL